MLSHAQIVNFKPADKEVHQIFTRGKPSESFILILSGKVEVVTGADNFISENGPWSWIGLRALTTPDFVPDFDCKATRQVSYLLITRTEFISTIEMILQEQSNWLLPKTLAWVEGRFKPKGVARIVAAPSIVSPQHQSNRLLTPTPEKAANSGLTIVTAMASPVSPVLALNVAPTIQESPSQSNNSAIENEIQISIPSSPEDHKASKKNEKKSLLKAQEEEEIELQQ